MFMISFRVVKMETYTLPGMVLGTLVVVGTDVVVGTNIEEIINFKPLNLMITKKINPGENNGNQ